MTTTKPPTEPTSGVTRTTEGTFGDPLAEQREVEIKTIMGYVMVCTDGGDGLHGPESWQDHEDRLSEHEPWNCPDLRVALVAAQRLGEARGRVDAARQLIGQDGDLLVAVRVTDLWAMPESPQTIARQLCELWSGVPFHNHRLRVELNDALLAEATEQLEGLEGR